MLPPLLAWLHGAGLLRRQPSKPLLTRQRRRLLLLTMAQMPMRMARMVPPPRLMAVIDAPC
jgi:hypothetical protein